MSPSNLNNDDAISINKSRKSNNEKNAFINLNRKLEKIIEFLNI